MGNGPLPDSVKSQIADGETVLWSHVSEEPVKLQEAYAQKPWPLWHRILWCLLGFIPLYLSYRRDPEGFTEKLPIMVMFWGVAAIVMFLIYKTRVGRNVSRALKPYSIYQNLVMTERQLIAFNSLDKISAILRKDVDAVETDFENGGPALRIKSAARDRNIVIIGLADFAAAKHQFYANA